MIHSKVNNMEINLFSISLIADDKDIGSPEYFIIILSYFYNFLMILVDYIQNDSDYC